MPVIQSFGQVTSSPEPGSTVFGDMVAPDFTHFMEWHIPNARTVRSLALWANPDGPNRSRSISRFRLMAKANTADSWSVLLDAPMPKSYDASTPAMAVNLDNSLSATHYRAEFWSSADVPDYLRGPGLSNWMDLKSRLSILRKTAGCIFCVDMACAETTLFPVPIPTGMESRRCWSICSKQVLWMSHQVRPTGHADWSQRKATPTWF
jgi:hypothetical protein